MKHLSFRSLKRTLAGFLSNRSGNIVVPFALTIVPIIGVIGASIDYSRAFDVYARLQAASDAAALVASMNSTKSFGQRKQLAKDVFYANLEGMENVASVSFDLSEIESGHRVDATSTVETGLLGILGIDSIHPKAFAESIVGTGKIEVALVIDNTGSMRYDLDDLKTAAKDFTNVIFQGNTGDAVKASVIPYITSVNVGSDFDSSYLDKNGDSSTHGIYFENERIAKFQDCSQSTSSPSGSLPDGFTLVSKNGCGWLQQPEKVNVFDLFDQFKHAPWKGCVEARPEPYDVLDTPPSAANPDTLFVPYFWPDESDKFSYWAYSYRNNYMSDSPVLDGNAYGYSWRDMDDDADRRARSILKYNNVNDTFDDSAPTTNGPNKSCPEKIQPLTDNHGQVTSSIANMKYYYDGGTVTSIGLMWGWRTLSPEAPYTEGAAYGTKNLRKIIVMMTDGYNNIVGPNANDRNVSDYSGYGYVGGDRFPTHTINGAKEYIDGRLLEACSNIKAKGILIYTVLFHVNDSATRQMYEQCATRPDMAMSASNVSQLNQAFVNIGTEISELRLTR